MIKASPHPRIAVASPQTRQARSPLHYHSKGPGTIFQRPQPSSQHHGVSNSQPRERGARGQWQWIPRDLGSGASAPPVALDTQTPTARGGAHIHGPSLTPIRRYLSWAKLFHLSLQHASLISYSTPLCACKRFSVPSKALRGSLGRSTITCRSFSSACLQEIKFLSSLGPVTKTRPTTPSGSPVS